MFLLGLRGRSVSNFSRKGKLGGVCWSVRDWILEFELGPTLWGLKRLAEFGGNAWIRHQVGKGRRQQSCSLCQHLSSLHFPSSFFLPLFLLPSAYSKCQIFWDLSVHAAVELCGHAQSLWKMPSLDSLGLFDPKRLKFPLAPQLDLLLISLHCDLAPLLPLSWD